MYIVDGIANQNEEQEKKLILFLQTCKGSCTYYVIADGGGGIFANNRLARAHSHAHAYYP